MVRKILLTAAVAAVVFLVIRARTRAAQVRRTEPLPAEAFPWRMAAWTFVALMVAVGGALGYWQWRERQEVVLVRVVNSRTGDAVTYRVRKGAVRGRAFETVQGRIVTLADVERLEVLGAGEKEER